jgi:hypothetical protein
VPGKVLIESFLIYIALPKAYKKDGIYPGENNQVNQ